tara:strand:- start:32 stop:343 length:312 start_codon:yes stop_codon:yes gene_type:complete
MPCDKIQRNSVRLDVADWSLLKAAALSVDARAYVADHAIRVNVGGRLVTVQRGSNTATVNVGDESAVDALKRAYSGEAVKAMARRFNWGVKATAKGYQVVKRF